MKDKKLSLKVKIAIGILGFFALCILILIIIGFIFDWKDTLMALGIISFGLLLLWSANIIGEYTAEKELKK